MTDSTTHTNDPDQIREDIERTRANLGSDVDALAEKVRPSSIVHRQTDKVKAAATSVRERVMGAASGAKNSAGSTASSAGHAITGAPQKMKSTAEGHPMAVGLIAFGVGLLASSLIPASSKERELAGTAKQKLEPLKSELTDVAKDVAENLKEPAREAVESVKSSAMGAVDSVKGEASTAASDVKDSAASARDEVRQ